MLRHVTLIFPVILVVFYGAAFGQDAFSLSDLTFKKFFAQRTGEKATYCLLGNGFFRTISSGEEDAMISEWLRQHPDAKAIPVSIIGEGSKMGPIVYIWAVDGNENLNLSLVKNGVFPGSVMLDAVHFDKLSKDTLDRANIEAGAAYAKKLNPNLPDAPESPPRRLVADSTYDFFLGKLKEAQDDAQTHKVGIWSDKFKGLPGYSVKPTKEFSEAIQVAVQEAKKINGDIKRFVTLTKPMAPLDINIRSYIDPQKASAEKNNFYGTIGAAAGLGPDFHKTPTADFFARYKNGKTPEWVSQNLGELVKLINLFNNIQKIRIISTWSAGEYRVNDIFVTKGNTVEFECNNFPYFPCPKSTILSREQITPQTNVILNAALPLVAEMQRLKVVALAKGDYGTRAIIDGLSTLEVGILVPPKGRESVAPVLPDGKNLVFKKQISTEAFFYGTN